MHKCTDHAKVVFVQFGNRKVLIACVHRQIKPIQGKSRLNPFCTIPTTMFNTKIKMAGVAGLEPVTSAVTGQRSNQLSYTPAKGNETLKKVCPDVKFWLGSFLPEFFPTQFSKSLKNGV